MNKKALSSVIAVVLLISISILAVGILSTYVIKSSKSIQLSPESSCLDLKINQALKIESVCYDSKLAIKEIKTTIRRNINTEQISSLSFTHIIENKRERWEVGGTCANCKLPEQGESKVYNLAPSDFEGGELILSTSSCELDRKEIKPCT